MNDVACSDCGYTPREQGFTDEDPWTHWACPDHYNPFCSGCEGVLEIKQQSKEN